MHFTNSNAIECLQMKSWCSFYMYLKIKKAENENFKYNITKSGFNTTLKITSSNHQ